MPGAWAGSHQAIDVVRKQDEDGLRDDWELAEPCKGAVTKALAPFKNHRKVKGF